jgi:hypothetical protein
MKGMRLYIAVSSLILLMSWQLIAFSQDATDTTYKNNLLPSPSFTYAPETDLVLGVFALYQFKTPKSDYATRPSNAILYLASSLKKQRTARLEYTLFLPPSDKWFLNGVFEYKRWPEQFYGIGPESNEEDLIIAQYDIVKFNQRIYKNLGKKLFVGLQFQYMNSYNVQFTNEEGEPIEKPDIIGNLGIPNIGIGFGILKDERNSVLTPTEKYYLELSNYMYFKGLGSSTEFFSFLIDVRKYFNFNTHFKHILALQAKTLLTAGDVPFYELARMGGKSIMRGYLEGRYRDKQYIQLQAEYRLNLIGRFGITTFGGLGNVMPKLNAFDPATIKAAVGFGLRFNINRKDPANVRIDFGYGFEKNATGVYITFGEAF